MDSESLERRGREEEGGCQEVGEVGRGREGNKRGDGGRLTLDTKTFLYIEIDSRHVIFCGFLSSTCRFLNETKNIKLTKFCLVL